MPTVTVITPEIALEDARERGLVESTKFWEEHQELMSQLHFGDEFWSDIVKRLKQEKRYSEAAVICRNARPVPAAFRNLLICLRKMYTTSDDKAQVLKELYSTAFMATILNRVQYIEYEINGNKSGCPGFNAVSIMWKHWEKQQIDIQYSKVGYEHINWLNKTDCKRLSSAWGEPEKHTDPFDLYQKEWNWAVSEVAKAETARRKEFKKDLDEIRGRSRGRSNRRGLTTVLLSVGFVLAHAVLYMVLKRGILGQTDAILMALPVLMYPVASLVMLGVCVRLCNRKSMAALWYLLSALICAGGLVMAVVELNGFLEVA